MKNVRILMASVEDVRDIRSWSGTPNHMHAGLVDAGLDVRIASPLRERLGWPLKALQGARNAVAPGYYSRRREPLLLGGYAGQLEAAISTHRPDLVLAPSTLPVARLRADVPVVTWTDATFAGMVDFYPSYTGLSRRHLRLGHEMERSALDRVALAVYSSAWAAQSAVRDYGVPEDRIAVVPFGANIQDPGVVPAPDAGNGVCRLLLVGRGWHRKGVDLAVQTTGLLRDRGVEAILDVVGSDPPAGADLPPWVRCPGALEKDDPRAGLRMSALYREAHFFLLPTRADCTPVVLAEAQAHGLPVVTSDIGGTASMTRHGASGWALPLGDFATTAAERMASTWWDADRYTAMRGAARRCYEETRNWPAAVGRLRAELERRGLPA